MKIYLADLGHNQQTLSSDVYPLGVANLAMYAREYVTGVDSLDIRIFREPEDLQAALDVASPDILGGPNRTTPNDKLRVAFIGCGGRGGANLGGLSRGNDVVALCDVDDRRAGGAFQRHAGANGNEQILLTDITQGPALVWHTPYSVIGAPYGNTQPLGDTFSFFGATEDDVPREIAKQRGVDLVLVCTGARSAPRPARAMSPCVPATSP